MLSNIPEEIFHRIMWHHRFKHQEMLGLLPDREHLQVDRQFRFYALPEFQNARLVCRLWNKWLSNDFAFWRHFVIEGEKSLEIAKVLTARFPSHAFHIRIRVDHVDDEDFYDYGHSDSDESGTETDEVEEPEANVPVAEVVVADEEPDFDFEDISDGTNS
ncbi:hypothetical protein SISNIDRAFT_489884 [Sistotremastrum niveocremeum HHB9708]|uniref:F-box domain-containing protein n=1 Tax=Sistotremastrum niveocremeum HHB9708 TaxID=1314777 RepID=A0A164PE82_9AGAM|nr:hypothetical protein SISNIDRAFT_489884 [Sistotremastrum niveocremeum HHB9708]